MRLGAYMQDTTRRLDLPLSGPRGRDAPGAPLRLALRRAHRGRALEVMQAGQPGVSRHLSALRDAGLVVARKQGSATYYRIQPGDPLLEGPVGGELRRRLDRAGAHAARRACGGAPPFARRGLLRRTGGQLGQDCGRSCSIKRPGCGPSCRSFRAGFAWPTSVPVRAACSLSWPSLPPMSSPSTSRKRCCGSARARAKALGLDQRRVRQRRLVRAPHREGEHRRGVHHVRACITRPTRQAP